MQNHFRKRFVINFQNRDSIYNHAKNQNQKKWQ